MWEKIKMMNLMLTFYLIIIIYTLILTLNYTSDFNLIISVFNLIIVWFCVILSILNRNVFKTDDLPWGYFFIKLNFHLEPEPGVKSGICIIQCFLVHVFSVLFWFQAFLCHYLLFSSSCVFFPLSVFPVITSPVLFLPHSTCSSYHR